MECYLLQLEQVNLALASENCTNRDELCQLQSDLLDLIQLQHESRNEATNSAENSVVESINNDSSEDSNSDSDSDSDDNFHVGSRCRAPYSDKSGFQRFISYHNAIIFELEPPDTENTDRKATVMFCNPLTKSMQPCPYFLNGTCNYVDKCRYSHGECVLLEDLKKYEEPDFENLTECSTCLVKREDDLWKLCRITAISIEEQSAAVCIIETHEEVRAPFSSFLPITVDSCDNNDDNDVPGCSGVDMEEVSSSPDNEDSFIGKQNSSHHAWSDDYLGGWEKHTKGVASKLMVKMGYVPGQGLGKESDGRVEPVEAKILPKGQSLDRCADTSEKKDPLKKIKKKNRKAKLNEQRNQKNFLRKIVSSKKSNVFDVINKRLSAINVKAKSGSNSANYVQESLTECNDKDLNVKLFNVQEKIRTEERHGVQYKLSINRNESKDKIVHGQSKSKLSQSQERLVALKIREKALLSEIDNRKSHKKSCQF